MVTINSALYSPHLPTSPSPHPFPTRNSELTQHSALYTQHFNAVFYPYHHQQDRGRGGG
uniref:Uncharacterized protein n=1 Tax=Desertifilum tharense IPPAS B-1220 TaxID=1781255 RepID=A0ACD5GX83_9CYAN